MNDMESIRKIRPWLPVGGLAGTLTGFAPSGGEFLGGAFLDGAFVGKSSVYREDGNWRDPRGPHYPGLSVQTSRRSSFSD